LPAWKDLYSSARSRDEVIEELLRVPLDNPPGEKHVYSCLGYILLGLVIERVSGMPLADLAAEKVFRPLGMADTGFNPPRNMDRVARTANSQCCDGALIGEVHDENALAMGGISGNAGLFSTAPDMAVFAQMMLNGGELDGVRILSRRSVERMLTNRIDPAVGGQAYGLCVRPNGYLTFGEGFSDRVTGHTGYTGTSFLIDPEQDIFVILLTNRVYRGRDVPGFFTRRREFHDIVAASVTRRP
jgi:CubicO group peptidase (beta-lactamase class C family)